MLLERYGAEDQLLSGEYYTLDHHQLEAKLANGEGERPVRDEYGQLLYKEKFNDGRVVVRSFYHANGTPKEVLELQNNQPHGLIRKYLPGGEPLCVESWKNGSRNGITVEYQNGEKFAEVPYVSDRKNGVEKRWQDNKIVEEIRWKDDLRHGPCCVYITGAPLLEWYYKGMAVTKSAFEQLSDSESN